MSSGGSVKNWRTDVNNATFEIHDYPVPALDRSDVKTAIDEGWVEVKRKGRSKDEILLEIEELKLKIKDLESQL